MKISAIIIVLTFLSSMLFQTDRQQLIQDCAAEAGDGTIYLKEFVVELPGAGDSERPPLYRQSVILRGNNIYRFNLCNQKGEAVIRIYDSSSLILSSYDAISDIEYNPINFLCRKTGQYTIVISFKNGEAGEAIGIMSHVSD